MDWTRMGGPRPEGEALDRLAAIRAWQFGIGTRIEVPDDDLHQLACLKAAEAGGNSLASTFAKVFKDWAYLGVNVDEDFEPVYVVSPGKTQQCRQSSKPARNRPRRRTSGPGRWPAATRSGPTPS